MKTIATLMATMLTLSACSDEETSRRILEDEGYTEIRLDGYAFWGCGEDDTFRTSFTAIRETPTGPRDVEGVVCCGVLKDCTVRLR